ncbi:phage major capsid protein [Tellurirhabdus bombi]|uniref:phage major capsid protein n=1 Tax=Tellurirhabdus bombi TaxID=2907205 RepID=UPI001F489D5A|nr:phage major capsid protein [Tellurirhabdus bombi]
MKTAKQLRDARGKKLEELNALTTKAQGESRDFTPDEATQFDALEAELLDYDNQIRRAEAAEKRAAESAAPVNTGTQGNRDISDKDKRDLGQVSIVRGLRLMAAGSKLDGVEAEVHSIAERDAQRNGIQLEGFGVPAFLSEQRGQTATGQTTAAGDQGGVTVPTVLNGMIDALWARTFLNNVGATRLAGLQGNQDFLVQDTVPVISELTEIEEIVEGEMKFSKFSMQPSRRGASIPYSKQLLQQSSLDVERLILDNMNKALGFKLNAEAALAVLAAITSGNGNLLALSANGAAPSYENIVALESLIDSFETNDNLRYLTNTKVKGKLKVTQKFANTNGEPVWEKGDTLNGYPAVVSNIIPSNLTKGTSSSVASAIVAGDFSMLYVGIWGGADFVVDPLTRAKKGEVLVTCNMFWKNTVARAKSFAGIKDALTA